MLYRLCSVREKVSIYPFYFSYSVIFTSLELVLTLCYAEVTDHLALVPRSVEKVTYSTSNRELSLSPVYNAANYCSRNGLDGFSVTFRTPSMQFREVHLEGVRVSSALLWPGPEDGDVDKTAAALYWPNLEVMEILDIPPYTANGMLTNNPYPDLLCLDQNS